MERSLILLKPDCVERRLIGQIIARLEDKGLVIVALKMIQVDQELARRHYQDHLQQDWYPELEQFIMSGPVVAMVVQGYGAISVVRKLAGATNGRDAEPGTIRGDYSVSRQKNLIHASDGEESAKREVGLFFTEDEIIDYRPTIAKWFSASDEN